MQEAYLKKIFIAKQEELEEQRRKIAEAEKENNSFNFLKAVTMTVGFVAGNGLKLEPEQQMRVLSSIIQDSQSGIEGVSNTTNTLDDTTHSYRSKNVVEASTTTKVSIAPPNFQEKKEEVLIPVTEKQASNPRYSTISIKHLSMDYSLGSKDLATSSLKSTVYVALNKKCFDQYKGHLEEKTIKYVTYEEGHTKEKDDQYKLYAVNASGKCRHRN